MARYKHYNYGQDKMIAVSFEDQILPGTFEHTLHHLVERELSLGAFDAKYRNDDGGAPAYDPRLLLKIVLYAYTKGIVSSRRIAEACRTNVVFMALSADSQPHFTTIAEFIASSGEQIQTLFRNVLLVCDEMGLIGKEMFAIDGCKLPSNAAKEWSGTRAEFKKKVKKLEGAIRHMVEKHQALDAAAAQEDWLEAEKRQIEKLERHAEKIQQWLDEHPEDKAGPTGGIHKSNLTDPDSAKMKTSKGVIQGYDGVAAVDAKHQVIVEARAYGEPQEHHLLKPMAEAIRETFWRTGESKDIFNEENTGLTADAGFHTAENMHWLEEEQIDAYIADNRFRKRDPRFQDAARHKPDKPEPKRFTQSEFSYDKDHLTCRCPAGKELYLKNRNFQIDGHKAIAFMARQSDCGPCGFRSQCLKDKNQKSPRQIHFFDGSTTVEKKATATERMKRKIDSPAGRHIYGKRLGTVEPVFGNIAVTLGMDRFTLRGKDKVNGQWQLFSIVHNIGKIRRYGFIPI